MICLERRGVAVLPELFYRIARWIGGASLLCQRLWTARVAIALKEQIPIRNNPKRLRLFHTMKQQITTLAILFLALLNLAQTRAQTAASAQTKLHVTRDLPYAEPADPRQKVDIYAPEGAKNLPVVFWIHGGGWQAGDRTNIQVKPQAFADKGFVFVSTGYRLLPDVDMGAIIRDIAKSVRWVHDHIAEHAGDPKRILVMG